MADEPQATPAEEPASGGDPAEAQSGGEQSTPESEIRDPAKYYQAQAEKLERLLKKEAEQFSPRAWG